MALNTPAGRQQPITDFLDFASAGRSGALFECSSSSPEGSGSLAVTSEAVFLGEQAGIVRIEAGDIDSWMSTSRGSVFALTVESDGAHITYLVTGFRSAAVSAMTSAYGPEGAALRSAS